MDENKKNDKENSLDLLINKISLDNKRITELQFRHNNRNYMAKITPSYINLELSDMYGLHSNSDMYVRMNKSDLKTYWKLDHCCGATGFGQGLDDVCPACRSKNALVEFDTKDEVTFMMHAGYTKDLYNILTHLPTYCLLIESDINTALKQLYNMPGNEKSSDNADINATSTNSSAYKMTKREMYNQIKDGLLDNLMRKKLSLNDDWPVW